MQPKADQVKHDLSPKTLFKNNLKLDLSPKYNFRQHKPDEKNYQSATKPKTKMEVTTGTFYCN